MAQGTALGAGIAILLAAAAVFIWRQDDGPSGTSKTAAGGAATPAPTVLAATVSPATGSAEPQAAPKQDPAAIAPSFDVVKIGPTGAAVIAGRAEPGAKVTVREGGRSLGEVAADRNGEWVLVPQQPIAPGNRRLELEAASPRTGETVKSNETVALMVTPPRKTPVAGDHGAEGAATGNAAAPGGNTVLAVVVPRSGGGGVRVLQTPAGSAGAAPAPVPAAAEPARLALDTVEYTAQSGIALTGRAAAGATVEVYLDNEPLGSATADYSGKWFAQSSRTVSPGRYELRLDQRGPDGRVAQRIAVPFEQAAPESVAALAKDNSYVVQPGNNLWLIAQRSYGSGYAYTVIYTSNRSQIRDPDLIYPGQILKLPKS
jgi:nucleoid-associated protein YgaU